MKTAKNSVTEAALSAWRRRILDIFTIVAALSAGSMLGTLFLEALSRPGVWPRVVVASLLTLLFIAMAIFRQIDYQTRAWAVLLAAYSAGVLDLTTYGLGGDGRLLLLTLPIVALVLIGPRSGFLMVALSALTLGISAFLVHQGLLGYWLLGDRNSLLLADWLSEGIRTLVLLVAMIALLNLFYGILVKTIEDQHRTASELEEARALLEEQNRTLEERIAQRTADLERSANERQESHRRLVDVINFLPDAVLVIDQEGKVIAWNRAIEEMTGLKAEEILGKGEYEYALPFYGERRPILIDLVTMPQEEIIAKYTHIRMEGPVLVGETYVPQLRGREAYLSGTAATLHDSRGDVVGAIEVIRDITERKRAEEALQKSEQLYRSVVDNSIDTYFRLDGQGNVVLVSPSGAGLLGYDSPSDMIGLNISRDFFADPGDRDRFLAVILKAGSIQDFESTLKRRDGSRVVVMANARVYLDQDGSPVSYDGFLRDFTERKRMEEDLHRAKEAAEAATQAKSAFLATMSHEIRTPMNAIIGMTGLLLDTQLTTDQREFAETIRNSGDALLTIINDILDFSKIEAGKMDLERQPFDLRECVESALDLTNVRAAEKGIELACEFASGVPHAIIGDVTRLRQVLVNLLSNAVKFTEQGEVVVYVQLAANSEGKTVPPSPLTIHFSVRDTGIGIPSHRMNRLFQAFSQVDSSTTRKYGGTGLGLAVSKRLSEMMGGTMWVESEGVPGKGSTFHFTIQAVATEMKSERAQLVGESPELRGRRVLIIDDNATNRRILTLQVQGWGMQAHATGSPQEALDWVRRGEPFDLAILDLKMPEMDGVELARSIQEVESSGPSTPHLQPPNLQPSTSFPMILLSSLGSFGREIPANLFTTCLNKPIRASALFDALQGIFAGQQAPVLSNLPTRPDAEMAQRLPLRILLADDYIINQKVALRQLAQFGYRADVAANGLEAIQALERQPYDVILMDVQMPEMDGLEATRQICARWPEGERPRIIAMTANAMQGDREMCIAAGMDDYVSKPIRVEELIQVLARCRALSASQEPASGQE